MEIAPSAARQCRPFSSVHVELTDRLAADFRELPFNSFWIADFQDADRAGFARPGDGARAAERVARDYRAAAAAGIRTVREAISWRRVERPGGFDFASVRERAEAASRHGIRIVWTLCRGDWPDDVDLWSAAFADRFCAYAHAAAQAARRHDTAPPIYVPFEEISFLGFCVAETGLFSPWQREHPSRCDDAQRRLVTAALAACDTIRAVASDARFLHVEPLPHAATANGDAAAGRSRVFDLLSDHADGARGHARYLDLLGVNCYASRETATRPLTPLPGVRGARRGAPLARALAALAGRYGRPLVIGERSPAGVNRSAWLAGIGDSIREAREAGVPIAGVCLRPNVDRPQWRDPRRWQAFGLWNLVLAPHRAHATSDPAYAKSLAMVRSRIDGGRAPSRRWPS